MMSLHHCRGAAASNAFAVHQPPPSVLATADTADRQETDRSSGDRGRRRWQAGVAIVLGCRRRRLPRRG
jgi:hypothetical protein